MSSSNNRSAFEAIPGKDALLEYQPRGYPVKTYVERNGLVYKSLTATSTTFISSQWELIADLREVRVPNIISRNALTGSTPTSGTTGIRIPILDNTNVLVLDAFNDPQVAKHEFARYNYNQTLGTWLLLQAGTGATNSNVNDYNLLINKKPIVSGVTVNAGTGLAGGGSVFGTAVAPYAAGGTISISHADTSSQASISNSGYAYIQSLKFDTFGHVTGATSSTWVHPSGLTTNIVNTGTTYLQSININNGHVIGVVSSPWVHPDTSSQASSNNSGNVFIQSIQLDTDGHVIGINTGTAAGGGGGGSPLKYNGDSGGVLTMNTGATLTFSGGTNVATVRTGNAANPGLKINFVPAGLANQIQINNGGALTASANLTFTGGTTLVVPKINLTTLPNSGSTAQDFIMRDPTSGLLNRLSISAIAALPLNAVQYRTVNGFGGNAQWLFDPTWKSLTLGTRTGSTFTNNFVIGTSNSASQSNSLTVGTNNASAMNDALVVGTQNRAVFGGGGGSILAGQLNTFTDGTTVKFAFGRSNTLTGNYTTAIGDTNIASGNTTIALGHYTNAIGFYNLSGGWSQDVTKKVLSYGVGAFNWSTNTSSQGVGHGALADQSAILGGQNHNIVATNTGAAIVGGSGIKLTGTTYINTTAVPNLAIMSIPQVGVSGDNVLVRNAVTGVIKTVTQASLSGGGASPAGSTGSIQLKSASGTFGSNVGFYFSTGTSQLVTSNLNIGSVPVSGNTGNALLTRNPGTGNIERFAISNLPGLPLNSIQYNNGSGFGGNANWLFDPTNQGVTLGTRTGTTGQYTLTVGASNGASGLYSSSFGTQNSASGFATLAGGALSVASQQYAFAYGLQAIASGTYAVALGQAVTASGDTSYAEGRGTNAGGQYSHAEGYFTIAKGQYSHAQNLYTKATGTNSFAAGGGFNLAIPILASGYGSVNISNNTNSQAATFGATGLYSAIFGGTDAHINSSDTASVVIGGQVNRILGGAIKSAIVGGGANQLSGSTNAVVVLGGTNNKIIPTSGNFSAILGGTNNTISGTTDNTSSSIISSTLSRIGGGVLRSVIIGGSGLKLTGTSQNDFVVVPSLMIWNTPGAGSTDDVLTWNAVTRKINKVTQASLSGGGGGTPAGANTQVQFNNSGAFGASANFTFNNVSNLLTTWDLNVGNSSTSGDRSILAKGTGAATNLVLQSRGNTSVTNINNSLTITPSGYTNGGNPQTVVTTGDKALNTMNLVTTVDQTGVALTITPSVAFPTQQPYYSITVPPIASGAGYGYIRLQAGNATSSGSAGAIQLLSGAGLGSALGGAINITAGQSASSNGGTVTLTAGASTTANYNGGTITINGATTSLGGGIDLVAGNGGGYSFGGGRVTIHGLSLTGFPGGGVDIYANNNGSIVQSYGGDINIAASRGTTQAGNVNITAGASTAGATSFGQGGSINIQAGAGPSSNNSFGGDIHLTGGNIPTGDFSNTNGKGGTIFLNAGGAAGASGYGGNIVLVPGGGAVTSQNGNVGFFLSEGQIQTQSIQGANVIVVGAMSQVPLASSLAANSFALYSQSGAAKIMTPSGVIVSLGSSTQGNGYSTSSYTASRSIAGSATLAQVAAVVATMVDDLKLMGILKA